MVTTKAVSTDWERELRRVMAFSGRFSDGFGFGVMGAVDAAARQSLQSVTCGRVTG